MNIKTLLTACLSFSFLQGWAQTDITNYQLEFTINDSTNSIVGKSTVAYQSTEAFALDFYASSNDTGMVVDSVFLGYDRLAAQFNHTDASLEITGIEQYDIVEIHYHGIPKDGLIISENKFGNRTFFGDNWPNRAHHWFPCIDHPSEKASVQFTVNAPNHYQVVANGQLMEISALPNGYRTTKYGTAIPLPTKVMVFGAAEFAHQELGEQLSFPVSTWVYPENKDQGFYDYALAPKITNYFIEHVAPYPYEKLANVQSTTRYGGMENAGCIFYHEHSIDGNRGCEPLMAHELAHQWFGNSASEKDWPHLWLSEGFATYLTDLYMRDTHGTEAFNERLVNERNKVIQFSKKWPNPVVDSITTELTYLLNPYSYQKGAWFLHMLRLEIGEDQFWQVLRTYYQTYKLSNANTDDFKAIAERISQKDLDTFFHQWLYQTAIPSISYELKEGNNGYDLTFHQTTDFKINLEIEVVYANGTTEIKEVVFDGNKAKLKLDTQQKIETIILDPEVKLLFETAK